MCPFHRFLHAFGTVRLAHGGCLQLGGLQRRLQYRGPCRPEQGVPNAEDARKGQISFYVDALSPLHVFARSLQIRSNLLPTVFVRTLTPKKHESQQAGPAGLDRPISTLCGRCGAPAWSQRNPRCRQTLTITSFLQTITMGGWFRCGSWALGFTWGFPTVIISTFR